MYEYNMLYIYNFNNFLAASGAVASQLSITAIKYTY